MQVVLGTLLPANRLVLETCISTGLRLSDVLNLRSDKLSNRFTVKEIKTGKSKRVFINNELLCRLLSQCGKIFVFEHRTDIYKHRTRQAVWHDIKRSCKLLRLPANVTPHSTRKSWAVSQVAKGVPLEKVQEKMNHSDLAVTMIYALADKINGNKGKTK